MYLTFDTRAAAASFIALGNHPRAQSCTGLFFLVSSQDRIKCTQDTLFLRTRGRFFAVSVR